MNFVDLESRIRSMPEFSEIGGAESELSFPLYKETGKESYIVHMVYTYSPYVPSGFVLTPVSTGEPEFHNISDALDILGMKEEDFAADDEADLKPAKEIGEFPEYTEEVFYSLLSNPNFDREVYAGYVYTLMDFAEPEERKYYRAFI